MSIGFISFKDVSHLNNTAETLFARTLNTLSMNIESMKFVLS